MQQNEERFNTGTTLGRGLIKHSLQVLGCGRSVLADKNGVILCGNDVYKSAVELGKKIVCVDTDKDTLVVVKRTDVDANSTIGCELALVDNLAQTKNLCWNTKVLHNAMNKFLAFDPRKWNGHEVLVEDLDLTEFFNDDVTPKQVQNDSNFKQDIQLSLFDNFMD